MLMLTNSCSSFKLTMYFPEDILTEIISKLPPKPLFRSKCVSKQWHHLISSYHFQRNLPYILSCICNHGYSQNFKIDYANMLDAKVTKLNLDFIPFQSECSIICCSHGLLLLRSLSGFHICNPETRRWFTLPSSNCSSTLLSVLAFDPSFSPHYYVICFTAWQEHGARMSVFCSSNSEWVEYEVDLGVNYNTLSNVMSYFNGILYVVSTANRVVCIQLADMNARLLELPEEAKSDVHIGKNGGKLCYYAGNDSESFKLWVLEDLFACMWRVKHCVDVKDVVDMDKLWRFLGFHPELDLVYFLIEEKIVSCSMEDMKFENIGEIEMGRGRRYLNQIWLFKFSNNLSECLRKLQN